jgi:drug/metabolite transporter (DMT)-like permease
MWVFLSLAAGILQSVRNGLARSIAGRVSPTLNTWARFSFNLPFSTLLVGAVAGIHGIPEASPLYYALSFGTGLTQLLGNVCLVAAFRHTSFAQAIVLGKLEILFTALVGALLFAEFPAPLAWVGIVVSVAGVALMHARDGAPETALSRFNRGSALAILAGLFLVFASFLLKEASSELARLNPRVGEGRFEVAVHTLFHVTWMEVVLVSAFLLARRPAEFRQVPANWKRMLGIGAAGFSGSLCWFWAYSIALVAYVKAVGQVETIAAVLYSLSFFRERSVVQKLPGIGLVLLGILLVLLGGDAP